MNHLHLLWVVPLSFFGGFKVCKAIQSLKDKGFCEDCPRVEQEDPIGEKYGTRGGTKNDK